MGYESISLQKELTVDSIVSVHYFEYASNFAFAGESHDFWEFLYVDKGSVNVVGGNTLYSLKKGDVIFHCPGEFHNVTANGISAPNLAVIGFYCSDPAMDFFRHKILTVKEPQAQLLGLLIKEARSAYSCRLDDPYCQKLIRKNKEEIPFAAEQYIQMYLQLFLLDLIRLYHSGVQVLLPARSIPSAQKELFTQIVAYLEQHLTENLCVDTICKENLISQPLLQRIFRNYAGCGVIEYFSRMRINKAKEMIRTDTGNISQIADELGYSTIHYFSRQFKNLTGMTPSEYRSSIQLLSDVPATIFKASDPLSD